MTDIRVQNEGSVVILHGESERGRDWLDENLDEGMTWGGGHVVEPRFVEPILDGAMTDGLEVH